MSARVARRSRRRRRPAVEILLTAKGIAGEVYNCYDRYVSDYEVAEIAKAQCGSRAEILGKRTVPQHQIVTDKLQRLGMQFGGRPSGADHPANGGRGVSE